MSNSPKKPELIRLVKKVLQDKATPEERRFVEKYYDYFDVNGFETEKLSDTEKKDLEDKILHQIYLKMDSHGRNRIYYLYRSKWVKVAAAVGALVVMGSLYFHHEHLAAKEGKVINVVKQYSKNDVAPGGNKAILTLSNGRHIMLDSVHNGMLATQGNSKVSKANSGMLAYATLVNNNGQLPTNSKVQLIQYNILTTPRGGQYQLTLADGTKVWLNAASSLTYPTTFTGKTREVTLTGEAYFEVMENKKQPFKVKVGNMEVEDLGTHFDIMAYSDEPTVKTTLLEGSVKVVEKNGYALLHPGQQAVITKGQPGKISVLSTNTEEAIAWKNGYFSFYRTNINEIMKQISRWYNVDVIFRDSLHVFLNGRINKNVPLSKVFKMLEMTGELQFTTNGNKVIVRKHG